MSKKFAEHVLHNVQSNKKIEQWYAHFMNETPLLETVQRLDNAIKYNKLSIQESLYLALFIGMTTEVSN